MKPPEGGFSYIVHLTRDKSCLVFGEAKNGHFKFRSLYEYFVAMWLKDRGIRCMYEPFTFTWGTKEYTPDFFLPTHGCLLEVKGKWGASQKTKLMRFREQFPRIPVLVVTWLIHEDFYPSIVEDAD